MANHEVIRWSIESSPLLTLDLLKIDHSQIKREDRPQSVRVELAKCEDFQLQDLAHEIATQRSQKCGENFDEVYQITLDFYRAEREAMLYPQPA